MNIVKIKNGCADYIYNLTVEDGVSLCETLNTINLIDSSVFLLHDIFFDNAMSFLEYSNHIIQDAGSKGIDSIIDFGIYQRNSSKYLMNVLTSFFSLLEVEPKLIKRDLNDDSLSKEFISKVKEIENSCFEFRFIRKFRNYVQHNNLPFRNLNMDYQLTNTNYINGIVELNKKDLLQYGKWKNKDDEYNLEEEIINNTPEYILVEPLIKVLLTKVTEISEYIIQKVVDKYSNEIIYLFKLYDDSVQKGKEEQIALLMPDKQTQQARVIYFNITFIKRLRRLFAVEQI